ncbi:MAG: hypothetical protein A3I61_02225 [Acidobacteria bacterium RIFCSPLOWO2_02_FULL_68_18]|nr:MAG: hypothetical protein A3I61_02225 [Acidobacteria bacterium RIFCSPLOWO2_02_FULL_68_18]
MSGRLIKRDRFRLTSPCFEPQHRIATGLGQMFQRCEQSAGDAPASVARYHKHPLHFTCAAFELSHASATDRATFETGDEKNEARIF